VKSTKSQVSHVSIEIRQIDPKRDSFDRETVETWYDYYAGYSSKFAASIIENAELNRKAIILDPWNGSGTTTFVARQLGYDAIGIDINPVAILISSAKMALYAEVIHIFGLVKRIIKESHTKKKSIIIVEDSLNDWLKSSIVVEYRSIEHLILANLATTKNGQVLSPKNSQLPPLASFLILALMRAARDLASIKETSNPTWVTPSDENDEKSGKISDLWIYYINQMAKDIKENHYPSVKNTKLILSDSRKLPIKDSKVDFILTSPPYCTRIDYAVNTSFELAALNSHNNDEEFKDFRRTMMGAPLVRRKEIFPPQNNWADGVKKVLSEIQSHKSKASESYYYKTYWDYFDDTNKSLQEIFRCLKKNTKAVFVIQGSFYKEIYIDLPSLYREMGERIGFTTSMLNSIPVAHSLSQINVRSAKYRSLSDLHTESIILMEKK
jgi:DNA modification methylase